MKKGDIFTHLFFVNAKTQEGFINVFNDTNPLHTDDKYAKEKGFAHRVMHGNILNGFLSYFIGELLPIKNVIIYSQSIQFKNPIYLNEELHFEAIIDDIYESVGAIEFNFVFKNLTRNQVAAKGKIQIGLL